MALKSQQQIGIFASLAAWIIGRAFQALLIRLISSRYVTMVSWAKSAFVALPCNYAVFSLAPLSLTFESDRVVRCSEKNMLRSFGINLRDWIWFDERKLAHVQKSCSATVIGCIHHASPSCVCLGLFLALTWCWTLLAQVHDPHPDPWGFMP